MFFFYFQFAILSTYCYLMCELRTLCDAKVFFNINSSAKDHANMQTGRLMFAKADLSLYTPLSDIKQCQSAKEKHFHQGSDLLIPHIFISHLQPSCKLNWHTRHQCTQQRHQNMCWTNMYGMYISSMNGKRNHEVIIIATWVWKRQLMLAF